MTMPEGLDPEQETNDTPASVPQQNSRRPLGAPSGNEPASEDSTTNFGSSGQENPYKWIVTGSDNPNEYVVQSRMDARSHHNWIEIVADENESRSGDPDLMGIFKLKCWMSAGMGGEARKESIAVAGGIMKAMQSMMGGIGGFFNRTSKGFEQPKQQD